MVFGLYRGVRHLWNHRAYFLSRIRSEKGAVATEYGLLLVLIALAIVAAATALGLAIAGVFEDAEGELNKVGGGGDGGGGGE